MSVNVMVAACAGAALFLSIGALPASAQAVIKVNDDVNFKFGVLGQVQADTISNPEPEPNTNNLFIRRLRLVFAGEVAKNVTFFVQTDAPNLGKELSTGKNIAPSVILQDAYASVKVADALTFDAGLIFVPGSRDNLTLTSTLLPIDYGPFTFSDITQEESTVGRDTGVQARGYLLGSRLEYRLGAFQGFRVAGSDNPFRYAGRVQYNLLDTETGYLYTATSLGKKKILAVGATFDAQGDDFRAYDADVFVDHPLGPGAVTGQFAYNHFDGGSRATTLPKQNDILVEAGYLINALKLTPLLEFARRDISGGSAGDETITSVGANYYWAGLNANVKAAYSRISPKGLPKQNEFTVQLQVFYF
jgi:Phosphate-selective porin O and P